MSAQQKVIDTALQLFTEKGYFNTSMRDITRESAVSTGSVYHYFKDKEGIATALYLPQFAYSKADYQLLQVKTCSYDHFPGDEHCLSSRKTSCSVVGLENLNTQNLKNRNQ